ncbi:MAG: nickel-dependent lactate racemase [Lentisphaerae bacterium]|nr:nickel-dependent lactate racemase [Lentisphaerota bacterium]
MTIAVAIPADRAECLGTLTSSFRAPALADTAIDEALNHPIRLNRAGPAVEECILPGESVCLVVSDQTRPTAAHRVLPVLLKRLTGRGCKLSDFFILVATGIHRGPTPAELSKILGRDMMAAFSGRIFIHDPDDEASLLSVGRTSRGHEVRLNRRAVEAQRLVLLGAASYHYYAGFGGGRKSLVPGLAARATIAYNHSLTLDPQQDCIRAGVEIGRLDGNAVAEEMLEGARLHPPDFIVNTVLTPAGQLAGVFAGDLDMAHRAACAFCERVDRIDLPRKAGFVVADASAAPNWIQAHKGLFNAARAVHSAGRVILLAPCPEGLGNERFRFFITRGTLAEIFQLLRQNPEVNGQTALSTRLLGERAVLVTQLKERDAADLGIRTAPDLASAMEQALADFARAGNKRPTYYLMPEALKIVPFVEER